MLRYFRFCVLALAAVIASVGSIGCESSSHKSIRTYEYDDAPARDRQQDDQLDSEYKMTSPGEMTSPGQMVDE